jgi:lipopolysaccharide/colanic/teichoic acid biosynthesis glycosyltransferase
MNNDRYIYVDLIKPCADFLLSLCGFILLLPVFFLAMVFLFFANRGKVFFLQARPGKREKIFYVIKFKTMNDNRDAKGNLLPDNKRLTAVGKFVRKTSIDEIPQLLNVIKGDMSLIGPRPLLIEYLPLYNDVQRRRHIIKPGITGWAQINGRNAISWQQKFEYDVWYVDHVNFLLDLKILLMTISKVFKSADINQGEHITMEKFTG